MTNEEVLNTYLKLCEVKQCQIPVPARIAYAIIKNIRTLEPIAESIEQTRQMILSQYAVSSPDQPGYYLPAPGKEEILQKELEDLSKIENNIEFVKIPFSSIAELQLTIGEIEALYPMINGED